MDPAAELEQLLRPAAGGLYVVSTGKEQQLEVQRRIYAAETENEVAARWRAQLRALPGAKVVILGVPSDVGAGFRRGANEGPQELRARLVARDPDFYRRAASRGVVDLGDVFVVPQLLDDGMLSAAQLDASRRALYPGVPASEQARLPVSPLSIASRALGLALRLAPGAAPLLLGGDHSVAWPAVHALAAHHRELAILHLDAHTDLLAERLGVRHCFATWAYHANELVGRRGRLVQVGIRATRRTKEHWEGTLGVRQFWAREVLADPSRAEEEILAALRATGARALYLSNDIDGTDEAFADACGTPEPGGLTPAFVRSLLRRVGAELPGMPLVGADLVEVAPPLGRGPDGARTTLDTAVDYLGDTLQAILGEPV